MKGFLYTRRENTGKKRAGERHYERKRPQRYKYKLQFNDNDIFFLFLFPSTNDAPAETPAHLTSI